MNEPYRSHRRDFLTGRAAIEAARDKIEEIADQPLVDPTTETYLLRIERVAMACPWEVMVNAGQYPNGPRAAMAALDRVDEAEDLLTVYRDTSTVAELNRTAFDEPVGVDDELFALIERSLVLWQESGGAFDITSGPLSRVWGFMDRQAKVPSDADLAEALERVGSQWIELDPAAQTVRFLKAGVEINFNASGKGYGIDIAAADLIEAGVHDFMIHGGSSSVRAEGHRLSGEAKQGWRIGVEHPLNPGTMLGHLQISGRAVGTSGTLKQHFRQGGQRYGHILDPRTGRPAQGCASVTVTAPTAEQADAMSTTLYVLGPDRAAELLAKHPEVSAIIVTRRGAGTHADVKAFHLTPDDFQPADRIEVEWIAAPKPETPEA